MHNYGVGIIKAFPNPDLHPWKFVWYINVSIPKRNSLQLLFLKQFACSIWDYSFGQILSLLLSILFGTTVILTLSRPAYFSILCLPPWTLWGWVGLEFHFFLELSCFRTIYNIQKPYKKCLTLRGVWVQSVFNFCLFIPYIFWKLLFQLLIWHIWILYVSCDPSDFL